MTCIVAIRAREGKIIMGGDSLSTRGGDCFPTNPPKVFKKGPFMIGGSGRGRAVNILAAAGDPPHFGDNVEVDGKWMIRHFVPWIMEHMREGSFSKKTDEVEALTGSFLIVTVQGRIFSIQSDYSLTEINISYWAEGGGSGFALGVLYATQEMNLSENDRIHLALKAAEEFSAGVRGPFLVLEQE